VFGERRKESLIIAEVKPLRIPLGMVRDQPSGNELTGFPGAANLQH